MSEELRRELKEVLMAIQNVNKKIDGLRDDIAELRVVADGSAHDMNVFRNEMNNMRQDFRATGSIVDVLSANGRGGSTITGTIH